jgi:hypothetical protein
MARAFFACEIGVATDASALHSMNRANCWKNVMGVPSRIGNDTPGENLHERIAAVSAAALMFSNNQS